MVIKRKWTFILATLIVLIISKPGFTQDDLNISGFLQGLYGGGLDNENPTASELTASETRLQLRLESFSDAGEAFGRLDFTYDGHNEQEYNWELREGYVKFRLGGKLDFKVGRQILTWGTGDLIFINDLFAKDYQSLFIGRDDQYLKAPQDAIRGAYYSPIGTFSLVYTPRFAPNRIPTGERLSYFNPMAGMIVGGEDYYFEGRMPEAAFKNGEFAGRFSRYFGSADFALYGYKGFYKNPRGMDVVNMAVYYPKLQVYGFSLRMPALQGIAWLEGGYYDSREDQRGDNPYIPNSQATAMIGFERQIATNLTANLQYQGKVMMSYNNFVESMGGTTAVDEIYHLITSRITKLLRMETIVISAFAFYSPSEEDFYGRFAVDYKYSDAITFTAGGNIFDGKDEYTDFGAFQKNDNVYIKVTYGY
jgi:hypothetical protein